MAKKQISKRGELHVPISVLKARCSELVEAVARDGRELVITKRGVPVARVVPGGVERRSPRGSWRGLIAFEEDVVDTDWSDEFEVLGP